MGRPETASNILSSAQRMIKHRNKNHVVLDALGYFGPQTETSLRKSIPKLSNSIILSNSEIDRVIKELRTQGLVKELRKDRGAVYGCTFKGLIDYLRSDGPELDIKKVRHIKNMFEEQKGKIPLKRTAKNKQDNATKEYFKTNFPFLPVWNSIVKSTSNEDKCLKILQKTINDFPHGLTEPESVVIRFLEFEVKIFPETPSDNTSPNNSCVEPLFEKYLATEEAKEIREAYLAYLLQQYLNITKTMSKKEYDELFQKPMYFKELDQFAKTLPCPVLNKELFDELFQNYGKVEYYFIGMFVYNLLWIKEVLDDQPSE
jgi:hypothetical protein